MEFLKASVRFCLGFIVVSCHLSLSSATTNCRVVSSPTSSHDVSQALLEMREGMNPKPSTDFMLAVAKSAESDPQVQSELLQLAKAGYGRMEPDDLMFRLDSILAGHLSKKQFIEYGALRSFKQDFIGLLSGHKERIMSSRTSYHHVPEAEIEFAKTAGEINARYAAAQALINESVFQITTLGRRFLMDTPPLPAELLKMLDYKASHDEAVVMSLEMTLPNKTKRHFALRMNFKLSEKGLPTVRDLDVIELSRPANLADGFFTNSAPAKPVFRIKEKSDDLNFDEVILSEVVKDENGGPTQIKVRLMKEERQIHEDLFVIPRTAQDNKTYSFAMRANKDLLSRRDVIFVWNSWSQELSVVVLKTIGVGSLSLASKPTVYPFMPLK